MCIRWGGLLPTPRGRNRPQSAQLLRRKHIRRIGIALDLAGPATPAPAGVPGNRVIAARRIQPRALRPAVGVALAPEVVVQDKVARRDLAPLIAEIGATSERLAREDFGVERRRRGEGGQRKDRKFHFERVYRYDIINEQKIKERVDGPL